MSSTPPIAKARAPTAPDHSPSPSRMPGSPAAKAAWDIKTTDRICFITSPGLPAEIELAVYPVARPVVPEIPDQG